MITIEYIDEVVTPAEKPNHRMPPVISHQGPGLVDRAYAWALYQKNSLLQVAHQARLARMGRESSPWKDVQQVAENHPVETLKVE